MSRLSAARSSVLFFLSFLLSLSLLPVSLAGDYCSQYSFCAGDYCDCGTCYCDGNGRGYCSGGCGLGGGTIAGTVVAIVIGVGIILCLCSLCYRRRYANRGNTYATGGPQPTVIMGQSAAPMAAVPVGGGYGSAPAMQAIPVQYSQYPQHQQQPQQYGQPSQPGYGTSYAQQPMGGGQYPPETDLPPPSYTPQAPSAPQGETGRAEGAPYAEPYKPGRYEGERAL